MSKRAKRTGAGVWMKLFVAVLGFERGKDGLG